jgi:hypothetical protein
MNESTQAIKKVSGAWAIGILDYPGAYATWFEVPKAPNQKVS